MCSRCGDLISVLHGTNLHNLLDYVNNDSGAAAMGRLEEILNVLRNNGGCGSCTSMIQERIRNTF